MIDRNKEQQEIHKYSHCATFRFRTCATDIDAGLLAQTTSSTSIIGIDAQNRIVSGVTVYRNYTLDNN